MQRHTTNSYDIYVPIQYHIMQITLKLKKCATIENEEKFLNLEIT
jgi:hypothetical protein